MYPAQTSLIPITVALERYISNFGIHGNYPYWYLGTTPVKYLIGPVVPFVVCLVQKLLNSVSLLDITIYIIIFSYLIYIFGWVLFLSKLTQTKSWKYLIVPFILLLLLPWKYLSGFALNEGSFTIATNFIPLVLVCYLDYLNKKDKLGFVIPSLLTAIILLIHSNVVLMLLVGVLSICISKSLTEEGIKSLEKLVKKVLKPFLIGLFIATIWYGPKFWITMLSNPSIGGVSGIKVIFRIFDLLKIIIPLFLAIFVTKFSIKNKKPSWIFAVSWSINFLFLTLLRFIGDPDFWQDWTKYIGEVELGIWLLFSTKLILHLREKVKITKLANITKRYLLLILIPIFITYLAYKKLDKPKLLTSNPPEIVENLKKVSELSGTDRVYLSGSTVFWANAFYDIYQIRGGRDEVSKDIVWREASYTFREGKDLDLIKKYIKDLSIDYLLVHTDVSSEYYKDFKNINIWQSVGKKIFESSGDIFYKY